MRYLASNSLRPNGARFKLPDKGLDKLKDGVGVRGTAGVLAVLGQF